MARSAFPSDRGRPVSKIAGRSWSGRAESERRNHAPSGRLSETIHPTQVNWHAVTTALVSDFSGSGCSGWLRRDSIETRKAVLQTISNDHRNPLVNFAARESTAKPTAENSKPQYLLDEKIVTTSASEDKRTLQCSGGISVSLGDIKASKEVEFTVQKSSDGKLAVSVAPFQF